LIRGLHPWPHAETFLHGRRLILLRSAVVDEPADVAAGTVVEARSGEEGVSLAHVCCPDLVLMDLQLPGIDGVEAMHRLRRDPVVADVPVVAVTAFAMQEDRDRALADGFDGYLSKPISVRALPAQVDAFMVIGHAHA